MNGGGGPNIQPIMPPFMKDSGPLRPGLPSYNRAYVCRRPGLAAARPRGERRSGTRRRKTRTPWLPSSLPRGPSAAREACRLGLSARTRRGSQSLSPSQNSGRSTRGPARACCRGDTHCTPRPVSSPWNPALCQSSSASVADPAHPKPPAEPGSWGPSSSAPSPCRLLRSTQDVSRLRQRPGAPAPNPGGDF